MLALPNDNTFFNERVLNKILPTYMLAYFVTYNILINDDYIKVMVNIKCQLPFLFWSKEWKNSDMIKPQSFML